MTFFLINRSICWSQQHYFPAKKGIPDIGTWTSEFWESLHIECSTSTWYGFFARRKTPVRVIVTQTSTNNSLSKLSIRRGEKSKSKINAGFLYTTSYTFSFIDFSSPRTPFWEFVKLFLRFDNVKKYSIFVPLLYNIVHKHEYWIIWELRRENISQRLQ